ncbi:hypothetical protein SDC9_138302 [bioreactor metagenome]|uniref:Uncharacterized protein n=1 Tax=bioreactor metagenome TaxID=1076179 RepID=A0A645DPJ4_9ZZZZ
MDVHHVEILTSSGLVGVLDIRERNSRRAAVKDGEARIDFLDLFVGTLQQRDVICAAHGVFPEPFEILLVPDLPVTKLFRIERNGPPDIFAPRFEVFPRRARPTDVVIENRQDVDPVLRRQRHQRVKMPEFPFPLLRFHSTPIEVGADPVDSRLMHPGKLLRRDRQLPAAADMSTDAIRIVDHRRSRNRGESRRGQHEVKHPVQFHGFPFF